MANPWVCRQPRYTDTSVSASASKIENFGVDPVNVSRYNMTTHNKNNDIYYSDDSDFSGDEGYDSGYESYDSAYGEDEPAYYEPEPAPVADAPRFQKRTDMKFVRPAIVLPSPADQDYE